MCSFVSCWLCRFFSSDQIWACYMHYSQVAFQMTEYIWILLPRMSLMALSFNIFSSLIHTARILFFTFVYTKTHTHTTQTFRVPSIILYKCKVISYGTPPQSFFRKILLASTNICHPFQRVYSVIANVLMASLDML